MMEHFVLILLIPATVAALRAKGKVCIKQLYRTRLGAKFKHASHDLHEVQLT